MVIEFDPIEFQRRTKLAAAGGLGKVVGPTDAINLIAERERLAQAGFHFGKAVPTDVFLFGLGEASQRSMTKIGGLPYLHRNDHWPVAANGSPLPFVGQLNFASSKDILGRQLPGDIMLVFGEMPTTLLEPDIRLIWKDLSREENLIAPEELPVGSKLGPLFGVRWRTENFPDAYVDKTNEKIIEESDADVEIVAEIYATQISHAPFKLSRVSTDPSMFCCFAPIYPSDGPYAFCNTPAAIEPIGDNQLRYEGRSYTAVPEWANWGDGTGVYFYVDESGAVTHDLIP